MIRQKDTKIMIYFRICVVLSVFVIIGSSTVLAKDLPGAAQTSYGVGASGAFQFSIPIVAPAGRNGIQPNMSLSFSNGGGNGPVGVGWGVSGLGAITRCGRTFATDEIKGGVLHDTNDKFCLNGQRLIVVGGTYGAPNSEYRTEIDSFVKVVAKGSSVNTVAGTAPLHWEVTYKNGMIHEYGNSSSSRLTVTDGSVHVWKINKVSDRSGYNSYSVNYTEAYRLPNEINYQGGHKVKFNYVDRDDVRTSYIVGKIFTRNKRLDSIVVSKNSATIRQYNLTYEYAAVTQKSKLNSVVECGLNNECLTPISIEWQDDVAGLAATNTSVAGFKAKESTFIFDTRSDNLNREITKGAWADVNGDGRVDQIIAYRGPTGSDILKTYLQTVNSSGNVVWIEDPDFDLPMVLRDYSWSIMANSFNNMSVINQGQLIDVNGDGLVDIVYAVKYNWSNPALTPRETVAITKQETWINKGNDSDPNNRKGWRLEENYELPDFIYSYIDNSGQFTHYTGSECAHGCQFAGYVETNRGRFVDINGDGLVDWVGAYHRWNIGNQIATWINTGSGWERDSTYDMPDVFAEYRGLFSLRHGELVDVNGDGRPDWVQSYRANSTTVGETATWLNTDTGFQPAPAHFNLPNMLYENLSGWNAPRSRGSFIDVNGDGRRDFVMDSDGGPGGPYGTSNQTYLNTGKGWVRSVNYDVPFVHKDHRYIGHTGQTGNQAGANWPLNTNGFYIDMNSDGLVDYAQSYKDVFGVVQEKTWINTGLDWTEDNSFNTGQLFYDYSGRSISKVRFGSFLDINNDGSPDWVKSRGGEPMLTLLRRTGRADQVSKITTTLGVDVEPTFATLNSNQDLYQKGVGTSQADSRHITGAMYVVSSLSTTAGNGVGQNITEYSYSGAQVNRKGRGYLGFKTVENRNLANGLTQTTTFSQDYPYIGRPLESITSETANTNSNDWLTKTTNTYLEQNLNGNKTVFPYLRTNIAQKAELDTNGGTVYQWAKTTNTYETGNYGRMQSSTTQMRSSASGALQHSTTVGITYHAADLNNWLIALVKDTTTTTSEPTVNGSTKTRKDAFTYYPGDGRLHTTTREPDSSDAAIKLITTYAYDTYGNVNQESVASTGAGAQTRTNNIAYDSATSYRLPKSLTNALSQDSGITYHPQCDTPATVTSVDNVVTTYTYDNFCRQTSVKAANVTQTTAYQYAGAASAIPTAKCGASGCPVIPRFSSTSQVQDEAGNTQPEVTTFYNLYAKPFMSVTDGMAIGQVIKQQTQYDNLGRVERQSQPYFEGDNEYWTANQYDTLGRVTQTLLPYLDATGSNAKAVNSFSVDSLQRQKRVTINTLGNSKTVFANALGQIEEIKDADSKSLKYDYDSQGNLIKTTDHANNKIIVVYDSLGRRKSLNDPDMGLTSFTLDAFSQLRTETDAKGHIITSRYDTLGRLKERDVPLTSAPNSPVETSYFGYDDLTMNAIGKLSSVKKGANGQQQNAQRFGYDQFGRPDATETYVKGQRFLEAVTYNSFGQPDTREYPSSGVDANNNPNRFAVKYDYINGYLSEISGVDANNAICITHWKAEEYDALGRATVDTLGDMVTTTRTYDQAQGVLNKIQAIVTKGNAGTVQNIDYVYDANNNLESRADTITSTTETFEYDALDRLEFHHKGSETVEVRYDSLGNITYKSDVGDYDYTGQGGPHAVSRVDSPLGSFDPLAKFQVDWEWNGEQVINLDQANITNSNYAYDANGNITQQGNRSVSWTTFNKPASMMLTGQDGVQRGSLIEYDALFNRHYKQEGELSALGSVTSIKESTYYVGSEYQKIENDNGEILHRYTISTGGGTVQIERVDGSVKDKPMYMLGDNLGSTNVIINGLGEVEQRLAFDPWGARTKVDGFTDAVNGVTNKGYTGHETDDEVGLVNMNARIYDPVLGRFLSADTVLPDAYDMQAFNRYSYVLGNPLKYTDPTGHWECGLYYSCSIMEEIYVTSPTVEPGVDPAVTIFQPGNGGHGGFTPAPGPGGGISSPSDSDGDAPAENDETAEDDNKQPEEIEDGSPTILGPLTVENGMTTSVNILPNFESDKVSHFELLSLQNNGATINGIVPFGGVYRAGAGLLAKIFGKAATQLSKSQLRGIRSLEKQIQNHQQKLDDFKANPTVRPGMENLPKGVIQRQQQARIKHLETEINTFRNNIDKIKNGGG